MSHSVQIDIHGLPFSIETGKVAKQADGAVVVRFGASMVLATVVGAKSAREGQDFFPLTVEYRERAYAVAIKANEEAKGCEEGGTEIIHCVTAPALQRRTPLKVLV